MIVRGLKTHETRSWRPNLDLGRTIGIHAGLAPIPDSVLNDPAYDPAFEADLVYVRGAIIGTVQIREILRLSEPIHTSRANQKWIAKSETGQETHLYEEPWGRYVAGGFVWTLTNPREREHQPTRGKQGLWRYEPPARCFSGAYAPASLKGEVQRQARQNRGRFFRGLCPGLIEGEGFSSVKQAHPRETRPLEI